MNTCHFLPRLTQDIDGTYFSQLAVVQRAPKSRETACFYIPTT